MTPEDAAKICDAYSMHYMLDAREALRMGADALRRVAKLEARVKELEELLREPAQCISHGDNRDEVEDR